MIRLPAFPTPTPSARIAMIFGSLLLMVLVGQDLQQRVEGAAIAADAAAADQDAPDEATLQGEIIDGPDVVGAYFSQGYAWAEAHAANRADICRSDNRAFRDGCRAFVATRR